MRTGTRPECPDTPTFKSVGDPCFPEEVGCVIGACDGRGVCDPRGAVCGADATPRRNGSRHVRIKVVCTSDRASACEAKAVEAAAATSRAATGEPQDITDTATAVTRRRRAKRGALRFKTVLRLRLNDRGKTILDERAVDASVVVTIHREGRPCRVLPSVIHLLRFRK